MAAELVFENTKTKRRYKVVKYDPTTGKMEMIGPHGRQFEVQYSKESFQRMGYAPVRDDAPPPPPAGAAPAPPPPPVPTGVPA